jgi:hypothetical protein
MKKSFVKLEKGIQRASQANNSAIWDNYCYYLEGKIYAEAKGIENSK